MDVICVFAIEYGWDHYVQITLLAQVDSGHFWDILTFTVHLRGDTSSFFLQYFFLNIHRSKNGVNGSECCEYNINSTRR